MKRLLGLLISGALVAGSAGSLAMAQDPVTGALKGIGKGTKKAVETTGKAVESTGKAVGKTTKKGAKATAKGTKKVAKGTKKGVEKAGKAVNPKNW
jgi:hypothetical protein